MFAIIGFVVVLVAVIGGYVLEHGNLSVLFQPVELLIIGGAALGGFLIANPKKVVALVTKDIMNVFKGKEIPKQTYLDLLLLMFEFLTVARREGMIALEDHVNQPEKSKIFIKYPSVLENHHLRDFICDNLKAYISGSIDPPEFENLMDIDLEAQEGNSVLSSGAVANVADSLPGLGIVAAVLGVVITMGKIKEPPEVLGHSIGAALVGTFLGVLMCYGFAGPMSQNLGHQAREKETLLKVAKAALLGFGQGVPPMLAVEIARRAIPGADRPSYEELENALKFARKK
ncbi:MAG: flagellar motor stator protein MotA [Thermodesulfobacteriota bacterium]